MVSDLSVVRCVYLCKIELLGEVVCPGKGCLLDGSDKCVSFMMAEILYWYAG